MMWWVRAIGGWFVLLTVVAFVAVTVAAPRLAGGAAYTVTTGSMRPGLPEGTLIAIRPADPFELGIGDVITYQVASGQAAVVTHRIVGVTYVADGGIAFRTRGDANGGTDPDPVRPVQIRGQLWYALPHVGRLNALVSSGGRPILLYAVGAALLAYAGWMFVSAGRDRRGRRTDDRAEVAS